MMSYLFVFNLSDIIVKRLLDTARKKDLYVWSSLIVHFLESSTLYIVAREVSSSGDKSFI